jgi:acyl transferase domain-containing protein/acyl carrier protein
MGLYEEDSLTGLEIAVIGMSGRFPGARNPDEFWTCLKNGEECIAFFTDQELQEAGVEAEELKNPSYVKAKGILEDIEFFDSAFFGYTSIEVELMDPQTRIFHECSWEALEDAGYAPGTFKGRIGVYAGASRNLRWEILTLMSGKTDIYGDFNSWLLYDKDFVATRISYNLDLSGPVVNLHTTCSTSSVALHLACQGLLAGECHMALAGGIRVTIPTKRGFFYQEGMFNSPDGHCRAFDARSEGIVTGEGVGIMVLKPLENAIKDRDYIYAVVKSSAVNNDGRSKVGYTAPSVRGQAQVIRSALQAARVKPESISYVETHGTATKLGDTTEIEALKQAFRTEKKKFCYIGSVKSNIGHLDTAAGMAGLIKTVLALTHRQIPPSLHFETSNPRIDFENSPFIVNQTLTPWRSDKYPLRAGVSSFGVGGTNVHVILEEAPPPVPEAREETREYQLLLLSAKTENALGRMNKNLVDYFKKNPGVNLADAAYTLHVGRKAFKHRQIMVTSNTQEVIHCLSDPGNGKVHEGAVIGDNPPVVFMFSGQGSQYVNMARELYEKEELFRKETDRCFDILNPILTPALGVPIKSIVYPGDGDAAAQSWAGEMIYRQDVVQPLLFVLEYALGRLLIHWGIQPYAMIGYSIGEYVAACLSGVFTLEEALRIVALRGDLMEEIPGGTMISVPLPEEEVLPLLKEHPGISVAVVNGPSCIVSGSDEAVKIFERHLKIKHHLCMRLNISHAGHSKMMNPMLEKFHEALTRIPFKKPQIPYISTLTGHWISVEEAVDPVYWTRHLRETVRFAQGMTVLLKEEPAIFLELGPGRVLSTALMQHPGKKSGHRVLDIIKYPDQKVSDLYYLLIRLGLFWLYGGEVDAKKFYQGKKRGRIPLPTYSFDKNAYPCTGDISLLGTLKRGGSLSLLRESTEPEQGKRKKTDIADWFYLASWKLSMLPLSSNRTPEDAMPACWLVFMDNGRLENLLVQQLKKEYPHLDLVKVKKGAGFSATRENENEYQVDPGQKDHYHQLLEALQARGKSVDAVVHLWNITEDTPPESDLERLEAFQVLGYYSLIYLVQAMGSLEVPHELTLSVLSDSMQAVPGTPLLYPEKATMLGPVQIIPREYTNIRCRAVDIVLPEPGSKEEKLLITCLIKELMVRSPETIVAYRGNQRLVRSFEPFPLEKVQGHPPRLRERGVYLITGGLGGVGLVLAQYLAETLRARLVLCSRSQFPGRDQWESWLSLHGENDPTSSKIRKVQAMEKEGAEVLVCQADVSDYHRMEAVFHQVEKRFGPINGIIHCALHLDGALVHRVNREVTEGVFAAKVKGTMILKRLIQDRQLDFLVLCSSLSALLGTPGEVVYCAANGFLDAFAYYMHTQTDMYTYIVSINWDTWQEVGGAVELARRRIRSVLDGGIDTASPPQIVQHPLLQTQIHENRDRVVYISRLNPTDHWPLDEHRVMGRAMLPGTAYLEMARAALKNIQGNAGSGIEIWDLYLSAPLTIRDDEQKEVRTILEKQDKAYEFRIISRESTGNGERRWQEHARGKISSIDSEPPQRHDIKMLELKALKAQGSTGEIDAQAPGDTNGQKITAYGPRWLHLAKQEKGKKNWQLTTLKLDPAFLTDLEVYKLHPALLDYAVAIPSHLGNRKYYTPFSYKRVKIFRELSPTLISYKEYSVHPRNSSENTPGNGALVFDITLMDEQGTELVRIEEYMLLEVSNQEVESLSAAGTNDLADPAVPLIPPARNTPAANEDRWVNAQLEDGLHPWEGVEVFTRVLSGTLPRFVVSTRDLEQRLHEVPETFSLASPVLAQVEKLRPTHPRPELSTRYVAPRNSTEKKLAHIWQKFLGIDRVGVHDNTFDLGATSLTIMQISRLLKESVGKEVSVVNMYVYPTIDELARFLEQEEKTGILSVETQSPGRLLKKEASNRRNKLKKRQSKIIGVRK